MRTSFQVARIVAIAAVGSGVQAADLKLNVKPGLWEVTSVGQVAGQMPAMQMPDSVMQNMTPERRAQMEAMMKNMAARAAQPRTRQRCITEEQLKRDAAFNEADRPNCKRTVTMNSSSDWEVHSQCTVENGQTDVTAHFHADSPSSVTGNIDVAANGENGRNMSIKNTVTAKWLSADCGDVKPDEIKEAGK
jgi:hypothetical protein